MSLSKAKLTNTEEKALQALLAVAGSDEWLSAHVIAARARNGGFDFTSTTLRDTLSRLKGRVEYRTKGGTRRFRLRPGGKQSALSNAFAGSAFIRPGTPWSSSTELRKFLGVNASGFLLVIDPYVSEDTLDVLSEVNVPIRIIAANLGRTGKEEGFLRAYKKFHREKGGLVELRQSSPKDLHGRYVITDERGWVIDHSLQDIGTKPALILPLNVTGVFSEVKTHFEGVFIDGNIIEPK